MNAFVAAAEIIGNDVLEVDGVVIITRLSLLKRAARIAKEAAPYVYPRLVQVEMRGTMGYRSCVV
jgi:hypothetical protein